jgi:transcription antitermination factor NusG
MAEHSPPLMEYQPGEHWYALQTRVAQERKAQNNLADAGLLTFMPLVKREWRNGAGARRPKRRLVDKPLFPRYILCKTDLSVSYYQLARTPGVVSLVGFGGVASVIDEAIIRELQAKLHDGYFEPQPEVIDYAPLAAGQRVRIVSGPFKDFEAEVLDVRRRSSVFVFLKGLEILSGKQLTIERGCIRPV